MLHPQDPQDGFYELGWVVANRAILPGHEVPQRFLYLVGDNTEIPSNTTSDPSPRIPVVAYTDPYPPILKPLSALFPVPETQITLLFGLPSAALTRNEVILSMSNIITRV